MPDGDRRMLYVPLTLTLSPEGRGDGPCAFLGAHLGFCLTGDPQRGPGVWPMPVITGGFCGVTHQAKTLTVKAPARLNATIA